MMPRWTNHLSTEEEKKKFRAYLYGSKSVFERLEAQLQAMEDSVDSKELDERQYDTPSWAARQADINGYRRCLRQWKQFITLDQKDK